MIVIWVHLLVRVVEVTDCDLDEVRQFVLHAVGEVLLQVSDHREHILVDSQVAELQEL